MSFYSSVARPLMFMLPAETAHNLAMSFLQRGWIKARDFHHPILEQEIFGVKFKNPIGLAAGFDKHALAINQWHKLGFGFAEVGTVTWHPQPGNPTPRLFRLPAQKALINRFGFNNDGARAISTRLAEAGTPSSFSAETNSSNHLHGSRENEEGSGGGVSRRTPIPIGINLGKSKITELADAAKDYQDSYRLLHKFGAYFVVNVSSPNTSGLRSLQEKGPLLEILHAMKEVDDQKPLFFKVAPDLEYDALDELVEVAKEAKITGIIATNTTISREDIPTGTPNRDETGGLSGAPLKHRSDMVLRHIAKQCGKEMTLIGVGGITTPQDIFDKIALGAHLTQIYSGWIYGGPHFVPDLLEGFVALLDKHGIKSLEDLRGSAL